MSELSSCYHAVERLLNRLERSGLMSRLELSDEDIADTIWLALQTGIVETNKEEEQPNPQRSTRQITDKKDDPSLDKAPPIKIYPKDSITQEFETQTNIKSLPFQAPAAAALQNKLPINRALRPLMRKVPSRVRSLLDAEATVTRIAEQNIWFPVTKPEPERWLDLELVVEESRSSFIWTETIDELYKLLQNHGAFRTVRAWSLSSTDNDHLQLTRRRKGRQKSHYKHSYRELIHSNRRGLILLVSDCVSSIWQQGKIHQWLQGWSNKSPTAIIQLFPERLWQSSELGLGDKLPFSAFEPGVPNSDLVLPSLWKELKGKQVLKLPVVTLEDLSLENWAKVVAGRGNTHTPGFAFDLEFVAKQAKKSATVNPQELSSENLADRFLATASPTAQRLAGLMAAAPVDLRVVHLIQKNLLPKPATPVPIAEVFLSGLIQRIDASEKGNDPQYDFVPKVRKILNRAMRLDETENVLDVVSSYIADNLGLSFKSFTALLLRLQDLSQEQQEKILPFARVAIEVLQNLGGEYANFAQEVAGNIVPVPDPKTGKHYAITIGINQYRNPASTLPAAQYAVRDASMMQQWFHQRGFEQVYQFSDMANISTLLEIPSAHLTQEGREYLQQTNFPVPFLAAEDALWFYFSGYGVHLRGWDYLLLADSDLENLEETALPLANLVRLLQSSGAGKVILLLDADRDGSPYQVTTTDFTSDDVSSLEQQLQGELSSEKRLIIFYASSPEQGAYEIEQLQQGSFTYALREALETTQGNLSLERLEQFLQIRVTELNEQYNLPTQTPQSFIFPTPLQKWIPFPSSLQIFEFKTPTVNSRGEIIKQDTKLAQYFTENLGNGVTLEMVAIPSGTFLIGSPNTEAERSDNESPQHEVTVPPFFMGKYPVTQAQWRTVAALPQVNRKLNPDPSRFKGDNLPVETIYWYEAVEFCDRISKHTERHYRLPSEAEWEYTCRAGTTTPFHFGETITPELVNYDGNYTYGSAPEGEYREKTTPVGSFNVANAFGLYDMHGNVWEWCADQWHGDYKGAPTDGSAWINNRSRQQPRLLRGGSWNYDPRNCRSACRNSDNPDDRDVTLGFRVVVSAART